MPATPSPISFTLPDRRSTEVYVLTTKDGRVVVRSKDELAAVPKRPTAANSSGLAR
jgi:hypothetical protein